MIDSVKSVSSAAGWSYTDNDAVRELLRYVREGICQPLNHSIALLTMGGLTTSSLSNGPGSTKSRTFAIRNTSWGLVSDHIGVIGFEHAASCSQSKQVQRLK